jgi:predicted nucleic acid-binding protein
VKYVVDASVLMMVGHGEWLKIQMLGWHKKRDVAVPEPVVVRTAVAVRSIPKPEAAKRWTLLMAEMPRVPWTTAVSEKLLELGASADDLDAVTAAHALAHDACVLTMAAAPYERFAGLRVDVL